MNMHVATGAVTLADKGLHLPLAEGGQAYFNYYWLRDNCPSSFDSATRCQISAGLGIINILSRG